MKVQWMNRVENIVTKGENAHYDQWFLLMPKCFQKILRFKDGEDTHNSIALFQLMT